MEKELERLIELQKEYFCEKGKELNKIDYTFIKQTSLKMNIVNNNILCLFVVEHYEQIINILKKYQNKAIGEKTKEKICNEIKTSCPLFEFVHMHRGYYSWDSNNWSVTIELKNETFTHSRVKMELEFKYYNNAYSETNGYNITLNDHDIKSYIYRDDIDKLANDIINDYNNLNQHIKDTKEELNNKMDEFRKKYPYQLLGDSGNYEFHHL